MTRERFVRMVFLMTVFWGVTLSRAEAQPPENEEEKFKRELKQTIAAIKPLPETPIPDDPPPHEGALFDLPYIIEPPDLLLIEVLEALPGRPITGERLVRPDGTITLGFYGDLHVRGLTTAQAKLKLVEQLRFFLPDVTLGLLEEVGWEPGMGEPPLPPPPPADPERKKEQPPTEKGIKEKKDAEEKPAAEAAHKRPAALRSGPHESGTARANGRRAVPAASRRFRKASDHPDPEPPSPASVVKLPDGSALKITIEVTPRGPEPPTKPASPTDAVSLPQPSPPAEGPTLLRPVAPAETNRVFVDVSAYNSKYYYVAGDVAHPGRIPITGSDTVLDALNYAGGFIASADRANVHLIRPARGGKPVKDYPIDYQAITERGEIHKNYQLFPGDRLIVGRNKAVQTTIHLDREANLFQNLISSLTMASSMTRGLIQATPDLTPTQREALLKDWFELVWKASNQPGGPTPDEKTFREMLLRQLRTAPQPEKPTEKK